MLWLWLWSTACQHHQARSSWPTCLQNLDIKLLENLCAPMEGSEKDACDIWKVAGDMCILCNVKKKRPLTDPPIRMQILKTHSNAHIKGGKLHHLARKILKYSSSRLICDPRWWHDMLGTEFSKALASIHYIACVGMECCRRWKKKSRVLQWMLQTTRNCGKRNTKRCWN